MISADNLVSTTAENPRTRRPSEEAVETARVIKARLGRRVSAPVRLTFIRTFPGTAAAPPLARLLRSGRGSDVRVALYLSFLWFAANPPHDLAYPARVWATLLGLEDPDGSGTRRVRQAIAKLEAENLIRSEARAGLPSRIYLLDESGQDRPYVLPGAAWSKSRNSPDEWRDRYVQVPDALWTQGWISVLSGPALGMLLVLYAERGLRANDDELWFSPAKAKELYAISDDTRSRGLRELRAAGLVTTRRRQASRDVLDLRRLRNTYRLDDTRLAQPAEVPVDLNAAPGGAKRPSARELFDDALSRYEPPPPRRNRDDDVEF